MAAVAGAPAPFRLAPADAARYARIRMRMLRDAPWAFSASPETDVANDLEALAARIADHAIFAVAAEGGELVAAASIVRRTGKSAHRAGIWGVYVDPAHRGRGLGRAVVRAAVDAARGWPGVDWVDLAVSENAPAALRLYERLGFAAWGREPEALEVDGRRYDEIWMTQRLRPPG